MRLEKEQRVLGPQEGFKTSGMFPFKLRPWAVLTVFGVDEAVYLGMGPGHRSASCAIPAHLRCCYGNKRSTWHHYISRKRTAGRRGMIWPRLI